MTPNSDPTVLTPAAAMRVGGGEKIELAGHCTDLQILLCAIPPSYRAYGADARGLDSQREALARQSANPPVRSSTGRLRVTERGSCAALRHGNLQERVARPGQPRPRAGEGAQSIGARHRGRRRCRSPRRGPLGCLRATRTGNHRRACRRGAEREVARIPQAFELMPVSTSKPRGEEGFHDEPSEPLLRFAVHADLAGEACRLLGPSLVERVDGREPSNHVELCLTVGRHLEVMPRHQFVTVVRRPWAGRPARGWRR